MQVDNYPTIHHNVTCPKKALKKKTHYQCSKMAQIIFNWQNTGDQKEKLYQATS